jgi:hypothetical protein
MLTEDEKKRIRAEETLRVELRRELAALAHRDEPPPRPAQPAQAARTSLWGVLNSAVGMWFLTTVAAGAITLGFQWLDSEYKRQAEISQAVRRIATELHNRIDEIEERMEAAVGAADVVAVLAQLDAGSVRVYDDLKERNLVSLLVETEALVSASRKSEVQRAIHAARQLERLRQHLKAGEPIDARTIEHEVRPQVRQAADALRSGALR